jgi:hypothetical protein
MEPIIEKPGEVPFCSSNSSVGVHPQQLAGRRQKQGKISGLILLSISIRILMVNRASSVKESWRTNANRKFERANHLGQIS